MEDTVWQKVQEHCKSDGYSTQNEFIAKAIMFCGYLQSEYTGDFLPKILGETLEAILSMFGDRIGKLLLKQAVEQNICNHMLVLAQKMQNSACEHPEAEQMVWELARELGSVKGKKSYGYLPKHLKQKVDAIVDQMELLPSVYECYGRWWKLQCRLNDFYAEKERQRPPLSQQKEFRQIKNAVLQVAEQVRQNKITFEDAGAEQDAEQNATYGIPYPVSAWYGMATDESMSLEERDEAAKQLEAMTNGGDRYAQYLTGILYRDGGLLIPDAEKAQHYLRTFPSPALSRSCAFNFDSRISPTVTASSIVRYGNL